jgi:hypothetical protein
MFFFSLPDFVFLRLWLLICCAASSKHLPNLPCVLAVAKAEALRDEAVVPLLSFLGLAEATAILLLPAEVGRPRRWAGVGLVAGIVHFPAGSD